MLLSLWNLVEFHMRKHQKCNKQKYLCLGLLATDKQSIKKTNTPTMVATTAKKQEKIRRNRKKICKTHMDRKIIMKRCGIAFTYYFYNNNNSKKASKKHKTAENPSNNERRKNKKKIEPVAKAYA